MRLIYLSLAGILSICMIFCTIFSQRMNFKTSKYISRLHIAILFTILHFSLSLFIRDRFFATLLNSLFYAGIDWILLTLLDYFFAFTESSFESRFVKIFRYSSLLIFIFDTVFLVMNAWTNLVLKIEEVFVDGDFYSWKIIFEKGFYFHSIVDYLFALILLIFLVKKIFTVTNFYRLKYIIVFICLLFVIFANVLFMAIGGYFRYSILTYSFLSICMNCLTFLIVPREVSSKIKLIIADKISNAVSCFDKEGNLIYMNNLAKKIFTNEEEILSKYSEFNSSDKKTKNIKITVDGNEREFSETFKHIVDDKNQKLGSYLLLSDVTELNKRLEREKYRSSYDFLTGILNRRAFFESVENLLKENPNEKFYFVCTNIRNFKIINDEFGDNFGNKILKAHADILKTLKFEKCVVGRISGDKMAFAIQESDFTAEFTIPFVQNLKKCVGDKNNLNLMINLGIYKIDNSLNENANTMYDKTNLALKNNKDNYENSICFYDEKLLQQLIKEKMIVGMFDEALKEKQFCMYLQPQVSSKTQKVVGAEALVRWNNPKKGMIPPGEFVPILEKEGLLFKLDRYIWEEAAKKLSDWKKRGIDFYIAVNISAKDFYHTDLYELFTGLVKKYDIDPKKYKLEITETVLMQDIAMHSKILSNLQKFGFQIEMDDFGSGYSSLNMLKNIKMNVLKIDMAFLRKTQNPEKSRLIIKLIVQMAKALGMMIITEGVEEQEHVDFLTEIGSDIFQGYFFSKPISISEFEDKYLEGDL